jgi:hypothetical protein
MPKRQQRASRCASYEQLYCLYWGCERWATWLKGEVHTSHGTAALLQKREATPDCTLGACNPIKFTIFNLNETGWEVGKKSDHEKKKKQTPVLCCIFNSYDHSRELLIPGLPLLLRGDIK